jgi:hypothetical protein
LSRSAGGRLTCPLPDSIPGHLGVDFTRPLVDTPYQIQYPLKSLILQELNGERTAMTVVAVHNNFTASVELTELVLKLTEWHQMPVEMCNFVFIRFTNIKKENFISLFESSLEMMNRNF